MSREDVSFPKFHRRRQQFQTYSVYLETEHTTLEGNAVLRHALINRTIPKWERRTVQINNFGMTTQSLSALPCGI